MRITSLGSTSALLLVLSTAILEDCRVSRKCSVIGSARDVQALLVDMSVESALFCLLPIFAEHVLLASNRSPSSACAFTNCSNSDMAGNGQLDIF